MRKLYLYNEGGNEKTMEAVSVVIPCFNSQYSIVQVVNNIQRVLSERFDYQIILTDDCSTDGVWKEIQQLCETNKNIVGISLARNFGQQAARMAAIPYVTGNYVVFMDDDGQHPPEGILQMLAKLKEGYDIVYAEFKQKKESRFRIWGSNLNRKMSEWLIGKPHGVNVSSYFIARKFVVDALKKYQSPFPYLLGYFMSITRNIASVEIEHQERIHGKSGYTLAKLIRLWVNGFTSFSVVPLRIADILGILLTIFGFVAGFIIGVRRILNPQIPAGYTSIIVALLICSGMIMLMLGLMGEYLGRIFLAINHLPQYIVRDMINIENQLDQKEMENCKNVC